MLYSLQIQNLALIKDAEVEFKKGLNILTGETGAGKSILIGSINLALGARAGSEMIRTGADFALVELCFDARDPKIAEKLEEMDLPVCETVTILRKITESRSIHKINGESVSAKQVKEIAECLLDMHGQHEHQSLLQTKKHLSLLDAYAGEEAQQLKDQVAALYRERKEILEALQEGNTDETLRKREADLLAFECKEIDEAALQEGEDTELEEKFRLFQNAKKIEEALSAAYMACSGDGGAQEKVGYALREMSGISGYEEALQDFYSQLLDAESILSDLCRGLADYRMHVSFDEEEFAHITARLDAINRLKDKFGGSISSVCKYREEIGKKLEQLTNYENYKRETEEKYEKVNRALLLECEKLSSCRTRAGEAFAKKMKEALEELHFMSVDFAVSMERKEAAPDGFDDVEFLISVNPGEPKKSLAGIASGGELSRIMLALKTMIAGKDEIDTLIFDEIDAGISGKTAWKVSEKLHDLAAKHQVICITHLPQIAAMGDAHFEILKETDGVRTNTKIQPLDGEGQLLELARLLGAGEISEAALGNAKEMKKEASKIKQS